MDASTNQKTKQNQGFEPIHDGPEESKGDKGGAREDGKSGKGMAKGKTLCHFSKTSAKYWDSRIFKPSYTEGGERRQSRHYAARICHLKRRHTFPLGTGNKETASKEAAKIYSALVSEGWDATLGKFAPTYAPRDEKPVTVGDYIREAEKSADVSKNTLRGYTRAFRRLVSDIAGIDPTVKVERRRRVRDEKTGKMAFVTKTEEKDARHDYAAEGREKGGARDAWLAKVDAVKLADITPAKIQKWKQSFVNERGAAGALDEKTARGTANSILRKAKALFSKTVLTVTRAELDLPSPLPFDGVALFKKKQLKTMRYESKIDAKGLVLAAMEELPETDEEAFKIFLLAILAGLRRGEIDSLLWDSINFAEAKIAVEVTNYGGTKSEDSENWVHADKELVEILRGYRAKAKGPFVIESEREPQPGADYRYRAEKSFQCLNAWLKKKGVADRKPLHTLRKEAGTLVYEKFGIYAAQRHLRHSDIRITTQFYADQKERVSTGLGGLLSGGGDGDCDGAEIVEFEEGRRVG
jgi:integrase